MPELPIELSPLEPTPLQPLPLRPTFPPVAPPIDLPAPAPEPEPEPAPAPEPTPEPVPPTAPRPPQLPTLGDALPDLGILAALLVLLGLIALATALADFLNWLFRKMLGPLYRRTRAPQLDTQTLLQPLSSTLGAWEARVDAQLGVSFHKLAQLVARVGSAIVANAQLARQTAAQLVRVREHQHVQDGAARKTAQTATRAQTQAEHAGASSTSETHRARQHEQVLEQQHRALVHHVTTVLEPELEQLRSRIPQLERGLHTAWDELGKHSEALSIAGVTAATAVALERLGGSWIRCEANQLLGRANCGSGNNFLRRLVEGLVPALALGDLCVLVDGAMKVAETMRPALLDFVDVELALVGCHGASAPAPLELVGYSPTPVVDAIAV